MELIVLIIHLLVCVCLIGLVLLQRSEGGALGMGGGGGGSLMSGRGAADALARMTSVAGGFFLVTSLGLTVLSGAAASTGGNSNLLDDILPRQEQGIQTPAPAAEDAAPAQPESTTPDPTESSAPQATDTRLASIMPGPSAAAAAPSSTGAATRAAPLQPAATQPPATTRSATVQPASTTAAPVQTPRTQPAATQRSGGGTTAQTTAATAQPLIIPNTSGAVTGISLADDPQSQTESIEIGNGGVEAVRRERAGPDQ
jgi:preprotein translocase subunit SecG